ncbi:hypothetical protein [Clostridium sp.]|uniref:DUF7922 domain-containing protein n=1 Tax=Clostridium sp. TaxID=1506 RepID=UPI001A510EC6|nr:hypothetical protein [Clostridium sp.]MBK5240571.1 hypothetical protein [Clostridium sp.]
MTPKKNYSRYFIILQEDEKGYSLDSEKIPSGYAKLEMKSNKCKISYYVQNLRKEKQPYYMILICGKKDVNKIIKLGKLNIDDYGRVDISHEYDMENIADTGISAEKIIGAAIVKFLDNNVVSIMSGFSTTDKPNEWRNYKLADVNNEKKEIRTEAIINEFDEYEQNIELIKVESDDKASQNDEVQKAVVKEVDNDQREDVKTIKYVENIVNVENVGNVENVEKLDELEWESKASQSEDDYEIDRHKHKKQDEYPTGTMGDFFKEVAKDFEEVPDFSKEIKWCKWYKVPVNNLENMYDFSDYNKYTIAYYPMIYYYPYIRNHKYFMLGYKCDSSGKMKYIVYGIPGSRAKVHQPYGGKTGFVTWVQDKNSDVMGHWLMFYDPKKSTIVVPIKK